MSKKEIKIISKIRNEFQSEVEIAGKKYLFITEDEKPLVITRVYRGGEIILTRKSDYKEMIKSPDFDRRLYELMEFQHKNAVEALRAEKEREAKSPSDYLSEVRGLLRRKKQREAFDLLSEALSEHPGDPFLMSYHGCLDAVVNKNYAQGVSECRQAIRALKGRVPFGAEFFYPVFYLNLGRAHLAAGRKKDAVEAFRKGLDADRENADILYEMQRLGLRKKPAIAFLGRSNPLNKYIGMLLHKVR